MLDDTLRLGFANGRAVAGKPLSYSSMSLLMEDPQKYYLTKIAGHRDPPTLALAFGTSGHEGLEVFYSGAGIEASIEAFRTKLAKEWAKVPDPTIRINPKDPRMSSHKEDRPTTLKKEMDRGEIILRDTLDVLEGGWPEVPMVTTLGKPGTVEQMLGDLSKTAGLPYVEQEIYDYRAGRRRMANVSVVAGVPVTGYVDLVTEDDYGPIVVDHKFVTHAVSANPRRGGWLRYAPNYCPTTSAQLDLYSAATGIDRAGFQIITKLPQYADDGVVWADWYDHDEWRSRPVEGVPMVRFSSLRKENRYFFVWRPGADEHPDGNAYDHDAARARARHRVREAAEYLTESVLLLEEGVDPAIAFPAGNPLELWAKSCPFCTIAEYCPDPTLDGNARVQKSDMGAHTARHGARLAERERAVAATPHIAELRNEWLAREAPKTSTTSS